MSGIKVVVKTGSPGKSAYRVAVENGFEGTESEYGLLPVEAATAANDAAVLATEAAGAADQARVEVLEAKDQLVAATTTAVDTAVTETQTATADAILEIQAATQQAVSDTNTAALGAIDATTAAQTKIVETEAVRAATDQVRTDTLTVKGQAQAVVTAGSTILAAKDTAVTARDEAVAAQTALGSMVGLIRPDVDGTNPYFSVADDNGFSKFMAYLDGSFGTADAQAGPTTFSNNAILIRPAVAGVKFSVEDADGYAAVFVATGEGLRDPVGFENKIALNTANIATNTANIVTNTTNIATNTTNIGTANTNASTALTLATDAASSIRQDSVLDPLVSVADDAGFSVWSLKSDGSFGGASVAMGATTISNLTCDIRPAAAGIRFSVEDEFGWASLSIRSGESLKDQKYLEDQIATLQAQQLLVGATAGIPTPGVRVRAHRGTTIGGIAPEDSLDAVIMAARAGYTLVESDIQKTSDGRFVMCHDSTLDRTFMNAADYSAVTGGVQILTNTLATLRANYVQKANNLAHRRPIPTLEEYLGTCRRMGVRPLLEFKAATWTDADIEAVVAICVNILGKDVAAYQSFTESVLDHVRAIAPTAELQYLYTSFNTVNIDHAASKQGAVFSDIAQVLPNLANIAYAHSLGVPVSCWTVPNQHFATLVNAGVDEICSDTVAPPLDVQTVVFRDYSDGLYSAYTTTGTLNADGTISLASGQSITMKARTDLTVPFGAHYTSIDIKGQATVVGANLNATINETSDDYQVYPFQCMTKAVAPSLTITATAGGCRVKDIRFAIAKF